MKTLYDVLGVSRTASSAQIEQAYQFCLEELANDMTSESGMLRGKAIREAYAILSSPMRKQDYDMKLRSREQISYQVVENSHSPWMVGAVLGALLICGVVLYKYQAHRAAIEALELEAEKAKADAEQASSAAAVEQDKLERQQQLLARQAQLDQQRQSAMARMEGQQIQAQLRRDEVQAARDKALADQQAKNAQMQEETQAKIRSQSEMAAMQRALNIPIRQH
ncbi:MAG: DnaJ domain-containing protein [Burkholderiaceae bacterium]|nr:DnaJ domain-containing protein [Burkholderiaceae bacterium]